MNAKEKRALKKIKKEKKKAKPNESSSDSDGDSEHELFHYANDRVQLMKEVLKTLKLKKIKSLAPTGFKNLDIEEINTMLLEELLGISNKRLKKILDGQIADDASSSSSEDELDKPIDIISLDDISDDEDFCFVDESPSQKNKKDPKNDKSKNSRKHRIKKEPKDKTIKLEQTKDTKPQPENEKLLSVLELLELQARARAIRSQLAIEAENKAKAVVETPKSDSDGDDVAVIIESPSSNHIVISSSDEECEKAVTCSMVGRKKGQKIKIVRTRIREDEMKDAEVVEENRDADEDDDVVVEEENVELAGKKKDIDLTDVELPRRKTDTEFSRTKTHNRLMENEKDVESLEKKKLMSKNDDNEKQSELENEDVELVSNQKDGELEEIDKDVDLVKKRKIDNNVQGVVVQEDIQVKKATVVEKFVEVEKTAIEDIPLPINEDILLPGNIGLSKNIDTSPEYKQTSSTQKVAPVSDDSTDSESDVINLDAVEIEGIDD